ncbi:MAG TPA: PRC-barrel domain-containing protein [Anaerolineae bacterium]|nr:PRC-barrel domain-containing protein [Anaerolineae bacterium]HMR64855.1 PRC-barrel domain-containing protein [Anaerolineae bacterium]
MKYLRGLPPLLGVTILSLLILLGATGCGASVDQNDPDFTELVEEADNQATLDAQTFEDVAPDFDLEATVEAPDEDIDELTEDVPAEERPVIDQAPISNRDIAPLPMSNLFETDLLSAEGETWGELSDFSINVEQNRVKYAIVTFGGGLFNLADETIALPLDILVLNPENQLVIDVDREVLETAPGFDSSNLTGSFRLQSSWSNEADAFWSSVDGHVIVGTGEEEAPTETFVSASNLFGYQLVDDTEQVVGQIDDFIFDFNTGHVSYAVISSDAGLLDVDLAETNFLVPFSALVFQPATDEVQLVASPETIQSSPHFTSDNPPDFAQPGWDGEANTYWSEQGFELSPVQSDEESTFTGDTFDEEDELYDDSGISAEEVRSQQTVTTSQEAETPD